MAKRAAAPAGAGPAASALLGRTVVVDGAGAAAGSVSDVLLDLVGGRVAGLAVRSAEAGQPALLPVQAVEMVDAVAVRAEASALERGPAPPAADEHVSLEGLIGCKVVNLNGIVFGSVGDVLLAPGGWAIAEYALHAGPDDSDGAPATCFAAAPGIRFTENLLIVPDETAAELSGRPVALAV